MTDRGPGSRPEDRQATWCATLVDEWARHGITDAVVAPGSRNTPLLLALDADHRIRTTVVIDERSAGFVALGRALASGRPAVVVTTSGTAAVELHPAVVEAAHAGVPLLAVTADRPPDLQGVGAPQTIDQRGLFGPAVRWSADPGPAESIPSSTWRSIASRTVHEAVGGPSGPGPVHVNLAFREPLIGSPGPLPPGRPDGGAWHGPPSAGPGPGVPALARLGLAVERGLIVAGAGSVEADPWGAQDERAAAVIDLAGALGWPVLADPRSGCRVPDRAVVASADALLRVSGLAAGWRPDAVLRLGGLPASRLVGEWLGALGPEIPQVVVDPHGTWPDPGRSASAVVPLDPVLACRAWRDELAGAPALPRDRWLTGWRNADDAAQDAVDRVLAGHPEATEPGVARSLVAGLPAGTTLLTSSSMPVRDVEWYAPARAGLRVVANRGANGIDGVVSTALGLALAGDPVVALMGDLAFLYDASALIGGVGRDVRCVVVVVDNGGGGIFSFLPQAAALDEARFERYWGTPPGVDPAAVAGGFGLPVATVDRAGAVVPGVLAALGAGGFQVVVVRTDRRANPAVHAELHDAVAAAVSPLLAEATGSP